MRNLRCDDNIDNDFEKDTKGQKRFLLRWIDSLQCSPSPKVRLCLHINYRLVQCPDQVLAPLYSFFPVLSDLLTLFRRGIMPLLITKITPFVILPGFDLSISRGFAFIMMTRKIFLIDVILIS